MIFTNRLKLSQLRTLKHYGKAVEEKKGEVIAYSPFFIIIIIILFYYQLLSKYFTGSM